MASRIDADKRRQMVDRNCGSNAVGLRIDHRDGARLRVDDINLIANGFAASSLGWCQPAESVLPQIDQIEHSDSVRAAIADIGELPVAIGNIRKAASTAARDAEEERAEQPR